MEHYGGYTLNIDKKKMDQAWERRDEDPKAMIELCGYFREMAEYFARKFGINSYFRDDYISESLDQAQRALKNFNLGKSSTYSYFYKVMSNSYRYSLRRDWRKREKMPNMCSFDELANMASGKAHENGYMLVDPTSVEEEASGQVVFQGQQYQQEDLIALVKEGKSLARKVNKLSTPEAKAQFIDKIETGLLKECVLGIIARKEARDAKRKK